MMTPEPPIGSTEQLAEAQTASAPLARAGSGDQAGEAHSASGPNAPTGSGHAAPAAAASTDQLLDPADAAEMVRRWDDIQAGFVDRPRQAVGDADALVADLIQRLTRMFAEEHARLEAVLDRDEQVSTEGLRVGLQRYRDFFQRLLAA